MAKNNPTKIIVHHTGGTDRNPLADTSHHTAQDIDRYHRSLGWKGLGYHWYIEKNGKVVQGRQESEEGAHARGYNKKSIGVCLAGNFDLTFPTGTQIASLRKLLREIMDRHNISADQIVPHRIHANKTCYGRRLHDTWARDLVVIPVKHSLFDYSLEELVIHIVRYRLPENA